MTEKQTRDISTEKALGSNEHIVQQLRVCFYGVQKRIELNGLHSKLSVTETDSVLE